MLLLLTPDGIFHNFKTSKSVDRRFQTTQSLWIDGFSGTKTGKGSVGLLLLHYYLLYKKVFVRVCVRRLKRNSLL